MSFWRAIQDEQREWALRNFGVVDPYQPLLGIIEEIGEYAEAQTRADRIDAIADAAIFALHYCSLCGFDAEPIFAASDAKPRMSDKILGRLAHHHLKRAQGIRGTREEHDAALQRELASLVACLRARAGLYGVTLEQAVGDTWAVVRLRQWRLT